MNHDLELVSDAKKIIKVFDANGNFHVHWYEQRVKCFDFYNDRGEKEFRLYTYKDGSFQMSYLHKREALLGSW